MFEWYTDKISLTSFFKWPYTIDFLKFYGIFKENLLGTFW